MAERLQLIRHSAITSSAFTGKEGELSVNLDDKTLKVHDGLTKGGFETARKDLSNVASATTTASGIMSASQVNQLDEVESDLAQELLDRAAADTAETARATAAELVIADGLAAEIVTRGDDDATLAANDVSLQSQIDALSVLIAAVPTETSTLQKVFPVGAHFITTSNANPNIILGFGVWSKQVNRVIVGAGGTYAQGETGGASTKTLSIANMPTHDHAGGSHSHKMFANESNSANSPANQIQDEPNRAPSARGGHPQNDLYSITHSAATADATVGKTSETAIVTAQGSGQSFSLLTPYLARYIWLRTN